jgi:hypothetical protein
MSEFEQCIYFLPYFKLSLVNFLYVHRLRLYLSSTRLYDAYDLVADSPEYVLASVHRPAITGPVNQKYLIYFSLSFYRKKRLAHQFTHRIQFSPALGNQFSPALQLTKSLSHMLSDGRVRFCRQQVVDAIPKQYQLVYSIGIDGGC